MRVSQQVTRTESSSAGLGFSALGYVRAMALVIPHICFTRLPLRKRSLTYTSVLHPADITENLACKQYV